MTLESLKKTLGELLLAPSLTEKQAVLLGLSEVRSKILDDKHLQDKLTSLEGLNRYLFLTLIAIGQSALLMNSSSVLELLASLEPIEQFYADQGGIFGYHVDVLEHLTGTPNDPQLEKRLLAPPYVDVENDTRTADAVLEGLRSLSRLGVIYPVGGLGDRLNLQNECGQPLPVASLPFLGHCLLELLLRDLAGLEYLYYKIYHEQMTIPVALMTSEAKENRRHIEALCQSKGWFGRCEKSFFLFSQISVPVMTEQGEWSSVEKGVLNVQPGGHGALWRAADCAGVFQWLLAQNKRSLFIRQINNPLAGVDRTVLALIGFGRLHQKAFAIAAAPPLEGAAEGVLALSQRGESGASEYAITNIEYSDFERLALHGEHLPAELPANTNLLYADLAALLPIIRAHPLPHATFNAKSLVPVVDRDGEVCQKRGGRLESMMQNIADFLVAKSEEPLPTLITYQPRSKVIAVAKRSYREGEALLETPEGAYYELLRTNYMLFTEHCAFSAPPFCTPEEYVRMGPSSILLYHPALGPLYEVIRQKVKGGSLALGAELDLEIAEAELSGLSIEGSLIIKAEHVMGHAQEGVIRYSEKSGKCLLRNVSVVNAGIARKEQAGTLWRGKTQRRECFRVQLLGNAEFIAEGVDFIGPWELTIPDGERWIAYDSEGELCFHKELIATSEPPSIGWKYTLCEGRIKLQSVCSTDSMRALANRIERRNDSLCGSSLQR